MSQLHHYLAALEAAAKSGSEEVLALAVAQLLASVLSTEAVARRAGVQPDTISSYLSRSAGRERMGFPRHIPEPDIWLGESRPVPGWLPATIERWLEYRPGAGARRDLRR
jgi:hypothetical protein